MAMGCGRASLRHIAPIVGIKASTRAALTDAESSGFSGGAATLGPHINVDPVDGPVWEHRNALKGWVDAPCVSEP